MKLSVRDLPRNVQAVNGGHGRVVCCAQTIAVVLKAVALMGAIRICRCYAYRRTPAHAWETFLSFERRAFV